MSIPLPAPTHNVERLSSLENGPPIDQDGPQHPSYIPFPTARAKSENLAIGRNRQSILALADFYDSESPKNCRSQKHEPSREDWQHKNESTPRNSTDASSLSTVSVYSVEKNLPEPPYHVFSLARKKQLVYIVSLAGLFSPLSSNIYFPALGNIARDLKISLSMVSLTVTIYMIVQGLAPSFWGPLSDTKGRRITFIGTFVVYLLANVGLAFSNNLTTLMVFRAVQAAGSAATISVVSAALDFWTAADISVRMLGQSIGPVFGGIIAQYLGWHAIFWFLLGLGSLTLFLIILLLPETLRSIAGNGTVRLTSIHRPLIYNFSEASPSQRIQGSPTRKAKVTVSSIVAPLRFLFEKDVFITLFFGSIVYTVWSMVTSSTAAIFQARFKLDDLQVGLVFLPNGAGCVAGSYLTGYLMDYDYKTIERRYRQEHGIDPNTPLNKKELTDFPIEESRMRNIWWIVVIFVVTTLLYGFSLNLNIIALPLLLQFFIAYTATAVFSLNSALVIDLYPGASASATAVNNLIRCSVGAAGVAAVQPAIDSIGEGATFALFAGIAAACSPLLVVEWFHGQRWRNERKDRLAVKEESKRQAGLEKLVHGGQ
ncbi:MFS general substrate transporter [Diplocarpon rosae]|nr:MFS general substrate transporter [Diplocarpon rosae]